MYPFLRLAKEVVKFRRAPALGLFDTHVSQHVCWPWDLDFWVELNNGRTLTLFDLGRVPLAQRTGLMKVLVRNRWGLTVAGSVAQYRRRVRMFHKLEQHSRLIGWDRRFVYIEQAFWRQGQCTSHILVRAAITDAQGIVTTDRVLAAMGAAGLVPPPLPDWVTAWIAAESLRDWPPMQDSDEGRAAARAA